MFSVHFILVRVVVAPECMTGGKMEIHSKWDAIIFTNSLITGGNLELPTGMFLGNGNLNSELHTDSNLDRAPWS